MYLICTKNINVLSCTSGKGKDDRMAKNIVASTSMKEDAGFLIQKIIDHVVLENFISILNRTLPKTNASVVLTPPKVHKPS